MRYSQLYRRDERGVAAIEFAMVFPVFFLMLCGLIVYGLYFSVTHAVQQLTAEAARASVAGLSSTEREMLARRQVSQTIADYPFLKPQFATVTAIPDPSDPNLYVVTVRYDATHLGLDAFSRILPTPPDDIERAAIVRRGGY